MATRSGPNRRRVPALKRAIMIDTVRGKPRVRIWPRKRGKPKSPATLYMNAWFTDACHKMRYVDGRAMDYAIKATKQTGLYPRDLLMRAATRGLFKIWDPDLGQLLPRPKGLWTVMFQGTILENPPAQNLIGGATTTLTWNAPTIDTYNLWNASQPSRLTIPNGINVINVSFSLQATGGTSFQLDNVVQKNGAAIVVGNAPRASTPNNNNMSTGPLTVASGDFIELAAFVNGTRPINPALTRATLEILDANLPTIA
jgi:hypothetical protein